MTRRSNISLAPETWLLHALARMGLVDEPVNQTPQGDVQLALEVCHVHKSFRKYEALRNISLELRAGELLCLLGPSGCGKTTLLRLIAGLERVDQGKILKKGRDISRLAVEDRRCGIVFQNYALFPNLSVAENIAYGLTGGRWAGYMRTERVRELLKMVGLTGYEEKYPHQLSGGQQQRVALARALAPEPDLLLLDEPLSALDARVRLHLRNEIRQLQQKFHLPTVLVTHDQEEALSMADRIVVMNHGVIEQIGTPEDIYGKPASRFVATFVGQMNFLPAKVLADGRLVVAGRYVIQAPCELVMPPETPVEIGFRPEAVRLSENGALCAKFMNQEFLGASTRMHLEMTEINLQRHAVQIDVSACKAERDMMINFDVDPAALHVFTTTGEAIC